MIKEGFVVCSINLKDVSLNKNDYKHIAKTFYGSNEGHSLFNLEFE